MFYCCAATCSNQNKQEVKEEKDDGEDQEKKVEEGGNNENKVADQVNDNVQPTDTIVQKQGQHPLASDVGDLGQGQDRELQGHDQRLAVVVKAEERTGNAELLDVVGQVREKEKLRRSLKNTQIPRTSTGRKIRRLKPLRQAHGENKA